MKKIKVIGLSSLVLLCGATLSQAFADSIDGKENVIRIPECFVTVDESQDDSCNNSQPPRGVYHKAVNVLYAGPIGSALNKTKITCSNAAITPVIAAEWPARESLCDSQGAERTPSFVDGDKEYYCDKVTTRGVGKNNTGLPDGSFVCNEPPDSNPPLPPQPEPGDCTAESSIWGGPDLHWINQSIVAPNAHWRFDHSGSQGLGYPTLEAAYDYLVNTYGTSANLCGARFGSPLTNVCATIHYRITGLASYEKTIACPGPVANPPSPPSPGEFFPIEDSPQGTCAIHTYLSLGVNGYYWGCNQFHLYRGTHSPVLSDAHCVQPRLDEATPLEVANQLRQVVQAWCSSHLTSPNHHQIPCNQFNVIESISNSLGAPPATAYYTLNCPR